MTTEIICPKQDAPPSDPPPGGDPEEAARIRHRLFSKPWWMFFASITKTVNALDAAVTIVQARLVILLDAVLGSSALTTAGKIPKVSATDGTLAESALTDDGTNVLIAARSVTLDNAQILQQKNAAGTVRNLLTHFSDDKVYLDNADGDILVTPASGSSVTLGGDTNVTGDVDVTGKVNVSDFYEVAGTQVVTTRQAAFSSINAAVAGVAGATYGATEQGIINNLILLANNLRAREVEFEARYGAAGHGLHT